MWLRVSRWVNRLSLPLSWCLKHSGKISQIDVRVYITVPGIRVNKFQKKNLNVKLNAIKVYNDFL